MQLTLLPPVSILSLPMPVGYGFTAAQGLIGVGGLLVGRRGAAVALWGRELLAVKVSMLPSRMARVDGWKKRGRGR